LKTETSKQKNRPGFLSKRGRVGFGFQVIFHFDYCLVVGVVLAPIGVLPVTFG
jgi:hypothetical protein